MNQAAAQHVGASGNDFEDRPVATESIPEKPQEEAKPPDRADIVVGVLTDLDTEALTAVCDALRTLPGSLRIAVLLSEEHKNPPPANSQESPNSSSVFFSTSMLARPKGPGPGPLSMVATYQSVIAAAEALDSRGCCILASRLEAASPERAFGLAQPLIERDLDLVVPRYAQRRFDGLLNSCVIAPLMRALYGKRLSNPMGPDFGLSQRLIQKILRVERGARGGRNGFHPLASLTATALCDSLKVAELHLGTRAFPPPDWTNTSSLIAEALGPVFLDVERNAACWQRLRVSATVPAIGEPTPVLEDTASVDTSRLIESFTLGNRELLEIWGSILPPSTLLELKKLSQLPPKDFRLPDELWVRIVYDFALAHRLRTISRDHLLKSMTPLYLGWVASYVHECQPNDAMPADQRLERLALAYEAGKAYFLSRWRWPDRFNP